MNREIALMSQLRGTTFVPWKAKIIIIRKSNKSNFRYSECTGLETVDIKNGETRGNFTHDGSNLLLITMNN